ncbi:11338_t:CDS:2 [Cetraspora pellucida]|uniref:11338_t:CDS:1 n=1 Tax=Cetraspora pellucida TaxID=1433469 RepID=A0ACA9PFC9_9GLOM|nr:11338_t:CDS:2 [Cetraspora pellucida]
MSENYDYSMYESPEEESWSTDPNDQEFMFTHDYLAATNARSLLEERCNSIISLVSITQLVGTWEVELTAEESLNLPDLGVCSNHFNFDHGQLHSSGTKVLCPGLKSCPVFKRIPNIASKFTVQDRYVRFICTKCFEKHGRHIHKCIGPGKSETCVSNGLHIEDTNYILRLFSSWLFKLSYSPNKSEKKEVLQYIIKLLKTPGSSSSSSMNTEPCSPSPLLVKIAMKIKKFDNYSPMDKNLVKVVDLL